MLQGSAPILHNGSVVGVTTSSGYGHTVGKNIYYGYLPADMSGITDGYEIESYKTVYPPDGKSTVNWSILDERKYSHNIGEDVMIDIDVAKEKAPKEYQEALL